MWEKKDTPQHATHLSRTSFTLIIAQHFIIYYIKLSVCLSVCLQLMSCCYLGWIDSGLSLCDSCGLWHEQVCFYKSVSALYGALWHCRHSIVPSASNNSNSPINNSNLPQDMSNVSVMVISTTTT